LSKSDMTTRFAITTPFVCGNASVVPDSRVSHAAASPRWDEIWQAVLKAVRFMRGEGTTPARVGSCDQPVRIVCEPPLSRRE
jgi:hypothetical protein